MRTLLSSALALTLTATAATAGMPGIATAGTNPGPPAGSAGESRPQVDIVGDATGFRAPAAVWAGATTFRIRSSDPDGAYIGLVRLPSGLPLSRYLADLERVFDQNKPQTATRPARVARMYGGAAVLPDTPVSFTPTLAAGTYYLIDFKDVGSPRLADKVHTLRVLPAPHRPARPKGAATIVQYQTTAGSRFHAPRQMRAGAPIRITNRTRHINEAIFMPVRPGTTRQMVGAYFQARDRGRPSPYPFTGGTAGMIPISPGRSAVIAADLRPGTYALVIWLKDDRTGNSHAAQGMHQIITMK